MTEASRKGTPRYATVGLEFVRDAADPVFQVFVAKVRHAYEVIRAYELRKTESRSQVPIPIVCGGLEFEHLSPAQRYAGVR